MKKSGSDKGGAPAAATKSGGAAPAQAPQAGNGAPANGPSYAELQASLAKALNENTELMKQVKEQDAQVADMDQELNHLEEALASVRQNEEALTKKNNELQAQVQDLKSSLQKAQAVASSSKASSPAPAVTSTITSPAMEATTPGGTGSYKQAMQRLIEEHKAREEAEDRYSILAEKYSQMKEATGWAEIEGSAYMGAQRDGRRVVGGEVGKLVLQGYQRKIKECYGFAEKIESMASRLEQLCLHSAADEMKRHAQGLQSAASEAM